MNNLSIHPALESDLGLINSLVRRSKAYWGYSEEYMDKCMEIIAIRPKHLQQNIVKTCHKDQQIVGIYSFSLKDDKSLMLDYLFIEPDFIYQNIGSYLFKAAVETAKSIGKTEFILHSDPYAEGFYIKMGCHRIGDHPSTITPGLILPIMKYELTSN